MAFHDTTPTSLVIDYVNSTERRSRLDPSAAYRIAVDRYGYVLDLVPVKRAETPEETQDL
jgi:hypothetical protein